MPTPQPPDHDHHNPKTPAARSSKENWRENYNQLRTKTNRSSDSPNASGPEQGEGRKGRSYKPLALDASNPAKPAPADAGRAASFRPAPKEPGARQKQAYSVAPKLFEGPAPKRPPTRRARSGLRAYLLYGLVILLVVGIVMGAFVVTRVASFVNGVSVQRVDQNGAAVANGNLGSGRVNILLLGLDLRPNDKENGTRSDTMILVSIDQPTKTASMLSIPRDLWVEIPGHGSNRVNAAYFFGDQEKPGVGGPPLAKTTVSKFLGLPVDYFVQVDFQGFRQIVDAIGGLTLDVKKPLIDNEYPTEDFGTKRIYIPAGVQRMDGATALEYARSRHADSDLGRNQRQQAVLVAVREQGINLGLIGNNQLQSALQGSIKTDLQPGDILQLFQMAIGMNKDNIHSFSIDANLTRQARIDGNDVLLADKEGLKNLVQQVLNTKPSANATKESANISVLNGTFTEGLASRTQKFLETKQYTITNVQQASDAGKYPHSLIRVYNGKQKAATELAGLLNIPVNRIEVKTGGPPGIDLEVICGDDYRLPDS